MPEVKGKINGEDVTIFYYNINNTSNCGLAGFSSVRVSIGAWPNAWPASKVTTFVRENLEEVLRLLGRDVDSALWLMTGGVANVERFGGVNTETLCAMIEARPDLAFSTRSHTATNPSHMDFSGVFTFTFTPRFQVGPRKPGILALGFTPTEFGKWPRGGTKVRASILSKLDNIWRTVGGLDAIKSKKGAAEVKR